MKIDDRFSPTIAALARPSKHNFLNILGDAAVNYEDQKQNDLLKEIKADELKKKVEDDKKFAKLQAYDGGLPSFVREHGAFETAAGALAAENLFKSRAAQKLAEGRYDLAVKRANAPRGKRRSEIATPTANSLDTLNSVLHGDSSPSSTTSTYKTVTVYKDGQPITVKVKG